MAEVFGPDRRAAVCRELSKTYEEIRRGGLAELTEWAADGLRGEVTLVVAGAEVTAGRPAGGRGRGAPATGRGQPAAAVGRGGRRGQRAQEERPLRRGRPQRPARIAHMSPSTRSGEPHSTGSGGALPDLPDPLPGPGRRLALPPRRGRRDHRARAEEALDPGRRGRRAPDRADRLRRAELALGGRGRRRGGRPWSPASPCIPTTPPVCAPSSWTMRCEPSTTWPPTPACAPLGRPGWTSTAPGDPDGQDRQRQSFAAHIAMAKRHDKASGHPRS